MEKRSLGFHQLSWNDPAGRLFWQDGNLYWGNQGATGELCRDLFARGIIQDLVEKRLLIDARPADFVTSGPQRSTPCDWGGTDRALPRRPTPSAVPSLPATAATTSTPSPSGGRGGRFARQSIHVVFLVYPPLPLGDRGEGVNCLAPHPERVASRSPSPARENLYSPSSPGPPTTRSTARPS